MAFMKILFGGKEWPNFLTVFIVSVTFNIAVFIMF